MLVLIGLGGLGCPVLLSSLVSGVQRLLLVDGDTVSTSNLQRQVLYRGASEGQPKVLAARRFICARNPTTKVTCMEQHLTEADLPSLLAAGSDNFMMWDHNGAILRWSWAHSSAGAS